MELNRREALNQLCRAGMTAGALVATLTEAGDMHPADAQAALATPYTPTDQYAVQNIEGWHVRVNRSLLKEHAALSREVLKLLACKLYAVCRAVPSGALPHLQQVPIWLEFQEGHHPCMVYHPDACWLREHGMNPDKARCVEIAGAENFLAWEHDQPWMCLHELAHSYHDQVLSFDNPEIRHAYDQAVQSKSYESVLRISGTRERHYALTDHKEYFAECSEAYFGTNDFYPFVRAEFRVHDPLGYQIVEKVWRNGKA